MYMNEFENQYKVCLGLIRQKSREVSKIYILLTFKRPIRLEEKNCRSIRRKDMSLLKFCCFTLFPYHFLAIVNNIIIQYYLNHHQFQNIAEIFKSILLASLALVLM